MMYLCRTGLLLVLLPGLGLVSWTTCGAQSPQPDVLDERLQLTLIAESPVLRTPIGLAIDRQDRIYVLESHTHTPPANYDGPDGDRVLRFEDSDGDGEYRVSEFASGLQQGMHLAFSPDGVLHVACAREVLRLPDTDRDGRCDQPESILQLDTQNRYPHSALLGIAFDREGWMYLARGNNGSIAYSLSGIDGSQVQGYGDGGSILRCRPDGSQVSEYATGFWNPIQLKFDRFGRLVCVDNDPDARGPNRIVHVVPGGDYGHRNMYGGDGIHPFQAWNGELLGTLPYAGGTGEAPCDLLDTSRTSLPSDFSNGLLVTVWNENSLEWHRCRPRGVSFETSSHILVQGGKEFRPVAIDANGAGEIFLTDWVHVDYPNHGQGRLWRLAVRPEDTSSRMRVRAPFEQPFSSPASAAFEALAALNPATQPQELEAALRSTDPFRVHAGMLALSQPAFRTQIQSFAKNADARLRRAGLLAGMRLAESSQAATGAWKVELLAAALKDPRPEIRQAALVFAGMHRVVDLAGALEDALRPANTNAEILDAYLAAKTCLQPEFVSAYESRAYRSAKQIPRVVDPQWLQGIATDPGRSAALRAMAMRRASQPLTSEWRKMALEWLGAQQPPELQLAAIEVLGRAAHGYQDLLSMAADTRRGVRVRRAAIAALGSMALPAASRPTVAAALTPLVADAAEPSLALEAARALHALADLAVVQDAAQLWLEQPDAFPAQCPEIRESLWLLVGRTNPQRPQTHAEWKQALGSGGDPHAGKYVFFSARATCVQCHQVLGQGNTLGPNLSNLSQSVDRGQIVESILRPSDQFAPEYQAWQILTAQGQIVTGLQIDHRQNGAIEIIQTNGQKLRLEAEDIEDYRASKLSIMPEGLEKNLTLSQMRDLVAFLAASRAEKGAGLD